MSRTRAKQNKAATQDIHISPYGPLLVYAATVVLFLAASFIPQSRLWGVAVWGYFGMAVRLGLTAIALILPSLWYLHSRREQGKAGGETASANTALFPFLAAGGTLVFGLLFYYFRVETHFLGDGYTALSNLASESPIVKGRGIGEGLAHLWMARLLGGFTEANALRSYQIISIGAGVLFVSAALWSAARLFVQTRERILFALGCLSGGYLLLYFGYVEQYSLFVLAVFVFALTGVLAARGLLPRWLPVLPAALALLFHIFGVALVPAALYLLVAPTAVGQKFGRMSPGSKWLIALVVAIVGVIIFALLYSSSFFFRFALLMPFATDFTIEGYTLFSLKHLADFGSILLFLVPALLAGIALLFFRPVRRLFNSGEYRFLQLLALASLALMFLLDPKLGMARDWDLFSFVAVPIVVLLMLTLLDSRIALPYRHVIAVSVTVLGFCVLGARVGILNSPQRAIQQITDYIALDKVKGKHAVVYLADYYRRAGNDAEQARWENEFLSYPDERMVRAADSLLLHRETTAAMALLRQAVAANPMSHSAYRYIGSTSLRMNRCEDAYEALQIAEGLSPHDMQIKIGLGYALFCLGEREEAEEAFFTAIRYAPAKAEPYHALSQFYQQTGQPAKRREYLFQAIAKSNATAEMLVETADILVVEGNLAKAAEAYQESLRRGIDTSVIVDRIQRQPGLLTYFKP